MDIRRFFGSTAGRRFFVVRLVLLASFFAAFLVVPPLVERRERTVPHERKLTFSLPLPEDFAERNGLERLPDIESVHVTGLFARWKADNPSFRMASDAPHSWSITLPFPRGQTQYKFVLKVRDRKALVWIHDIANPHSVADGFGGLNSTLAVGGNVSPEALRLIFGSVAAAIALYTLLALALRLLGRFRFSSTQRALSIFCLVLLVAGVAAALYGMEAQRRVAREAYLEISDMVVLALEGQGFGFTNMDGSAALEEASSAFDSFFRPARLRTNPGGPTGSFSSVSQLVLFNSEGKVVAVGDRNEMPLTVSMRTDPWVLNATYRESMFRGLLAAMAEGGYDPLEGRYGLMPREHWADYSSYARASQLLGFNSALFPIVRDLKTIGYLGLVISPQVYASRIGTGLVFHCLWLACLLLCCLFLFLFKPTASELKPELVSEFVKRHGLTPRETELIGSLVAGQDYQSIADKNFISLKTVKTHVHNIYRKTEVGNRLELVEAIRQRK